MAKDLELDYCGLKKDLEQLRVQIDQGYQKMIKLLECFRTDQGTEVEDTICSPSAELQSAAPKELPKVNEINDDWKSESTTLTENEKVKSEILGTEGVEIQQETTMLSATTSTGNIILKSPEIVQNDCVDYIDGNFDVDELGIDSSDIIPVDRRTTLCLFSEGLDKSENVWMLKYGDEFEYRTESRNTQESWIKWVTSFKGGTNNVIEVPRKLSCVSVIFVDKLLQVNSLDFLSVVEMVDNKHRSYDRYASYEGRFLALGGGKLVPCTGENIARILWLVLVDKLQYGVCSSLIEVESSVAICFKELKYCFGIVTKPLLLMSQRMVSLIDRVMISGIATVFIKIYIELHRLCCRILYFPKFQVLAKFFMDTSQDYLNDFLEIVWGSLHNLSVIANKRQQNMSAMEYIITSISSVLHCPFRSDDTLRIAEVSGNIELCISYILSIEDFSRNYVAGNWQETLLSFLVLILEMAVVVKYKKQAPKSWVERFTDFKEGSKFLKEFFNGNSEFRNIVARMDWFPMWSAATEIRKQKKGWLVLTKSYVSLSLILPSLWMTKALLSNKNIMEDDGEISYPRSCKSHNQCFKWWVQSCQDEVASKVVSRNDFSFEQDRRALKFGAEGFKFFIEESKFFYNLANRVLEIEITSVLIRWFLMMRITCESRNQKRWCLVLTNSRLVDWLVQRKYSGILKFFISDLDIEEEVVVHHRALAVCSVQVKRRWNDLEKTERVHVLVLLIYVLVISILCYPNTVGGHTSFLEHGNVNTGDFIVVVCRGTVHQNKFDGFMRFKCDAYVASPYRNSWKRDAGLKMKDLQDFEVLIPNFEKSMARWQATTIAYTPTKMQEKIVANCLEGLGAFKNLDVAVDGVKEMDQNWDNHVLAIVLPEPWSEKVTKFKGGTIVT